MFKAIPMFEGVPLLVVKGSPVVSEDFRNIPLRANNFVQWPITALAVGRGEEERLLGEIICD